MKLFRLPSKWHLLRIWLLLITSQSSQLTAASPFHGIKSQKSSLKESWNYKRQPQKPPKPQPVPPPELCEIPCEAPCEPPCKAICEVPCEASSETSYDEPPTFTALCQPPIAESYEESLPEIKYYDPTIGDFSPFPDERTVPIDIKALSYYEPNGKPTPTEINPNDIPYYNPHLESARKKGYPPVNLSEVPYYEPQAQTNESAQKPVPQPEEPAAPTTFGSLSDESPAPHPTTPPEPVTPPQETPPLFSQSEPPPAFQAAQARDLDAQIAYQSEPLLTPLTSQGQLADLSAGKGKIQVITMPQEDSPPHERIVGKQVVAEPVVGQLDSASTLNLRLTSDEESKRKKESGDPTSHATKESEKASFLSRMRARVAESAPKDMEASDELISQVQNTLPVPRPPTMITPNSPIPANSPVKNAMQAAANAQNNPQAVKEISLSFNNVAMIEYVRYISRISNKNFIFDEQDLQFHVTIVSEEPTSVENLMASLLQELRIRDLSLIEQGNNLIIHRNPRMRAPARIVSEGPEILSARESELVTRIFRLNTLDPLKASEIIRPLLSNDALVEVLRDTNKLVITDLVANVNKIAQLINTLDAPNSGVQIGQYVVRNAFVDSLVDLATKILQPIAQGNPFVLVPHQTSNSIYIVSNAFIVEKALAILQNLDINEGRTKILSLEKLHPGNIPGITPEGFAGGGGAAGSGTGGGGGVGGRITPGAISAGREGGGGGAGPGGGGPLPGVPSAVPSGGVESGGNVPPGLPAGTLPGAPPGGISVGGYVPPGTPQSYAFGPGGIGTVTRLPEGALPGTFPTGGVVSSGQYYPPGAAPGAYSGAPGYPYASGGGGGITSEGYPAYGPGQLPPDMYPYGGIVSEGRPAGMFEEGRDFLPGAITSAPQWLRDLPTGHIDRTLFYIYKLKYRKGDQIEVALRKIANSLQMTGTANPELIAAINSSQWLESSNSLIFTGTGPALDKIKELILEVDVPMRQIFLEMLILETDITDSLSYGVDWITNFGGGSVNGAQAFQNTGLLGTALSVTDIGAVPPILPTFPTNALPFPGYAGAVIGTHLTHNGTRFSTIGGLVQAIHSDTKVNILLNPKIVTEDNNTAEIFVGTVDRYKTQSITNDIGDLVTNNFQFLDVGTTLRVTPLIGNNGIITLDIIEERTTPNPQANQFPTNNANDFNLIPILTKDRTVTKVHVPDGFFVVMSGMIQDNESRVISKIPCLGGIPIIGGFCKQKNTSDLKQNIMIFIRPVILDTDDDLEDVTKRQQDVYCEKSKFRRAWNYEVDEALDQFNLKPTDPDDIGCAGCNQ